MLSDSPALEYYMNFYTVVHSTLEMNADRGKSALESRLKIHHVDMNCKVTHAYSMYPTLTVISGTRVF